MECGKGPIVPSVIQSYNYTYTKYAAAQNLHNHTSGQNNRERAISFQIFGKNFQPISKKSFDSMFAFSKINK